MKKHWMKKTGILVGALGALLDLFVPGPWTQVGAIVGGAVVGLGVDRNVNEAFDKRLRKGK